MWCEEHLDIYLTVHSGQQYSRDGNHLGHHYSFSLLTYARFWAFLMKKSSLMLDNLTCLAVYLCFFLPYFFLLLWFLGSFREMKDAKQYF